ncbi:ABC transporter permease [Kibdelosporangium phytohabitans]|uniref:ABC transporter permease n=1 Tax=Kibdelosporangium phytohabitans TaxID=860235 RepID=A0A0N9IFG7_9PSEU|nr:ABC transporter permease subunit [Kibdelosporangium phytohabitans]ALG13552.1 ABC transporter permease [Kibdelosporangium phytohabitans]MBE1465413.1 osmoprotectant transport system permease protein [Kibdelosporangium phytohabitans]
MNWLSNNFDKVIDPLGPHLVISLLPVLFGLVISIPLGWVANRWPVARAILVPAAGILYTIPSLVLFLVLPPLLGTKVLDEINVIVALTIYTVALLVRSVADALAAVPSHVIAAANAMGYRPVRRFFGVELPLAVPVLIAGLRVATVSNISLTSVAAILGVPQLGALFTDGFSVENYDEIIVGIVLIFLLAMVFDGLLLLLGRLLTPWARAGRTVGAK